MSKLAIALGGLPAPMYEVIFRRVFLRQSFAEVADALDRTPGAARVLWTRAMRRLRDEVLTNEPPTENDEAVD